MGYWNASPDGDSFVRGTNEDGSEMLWGDSPADIIDEGMNALVRRLRNELDRYPTADEVDAHVFGDATHRAAPEIVKAIKHAERVFRKDVERDPTPEEITAGLRFSSPETTIRLLRKREG